jgi:hypothetical protein
MVAHDYQMIEEKSGLYPLNLSKRRENQSCQILRLPLFFFFFFFFFLFVAQTLDSELLAARDAFRCVDPKL